MELADDVVLPCCAGQEPGEGGEENAVEFSLYGGRVLSLPCLGLIGLGVWGRPESQAAAVVVCGNWDDGRGAVGFHWARHDR